jgi:hypothetical protein
VDETPRPRWFHYLGPVVVFGVPMLIVVVLHTRCT